VPIRWSPEAADDLERIVDRIKQDNPTAARRVAEAIYRRCSDLELFPNRGRVGRIAGTRELELVVRTGQMVPVAGHNIEIASSLRSSQ
jgi:toxin ParE1/3/4